MSPVIICLPKWPLMRGNACFVLATDGPEKKCPELLSSPLERVTCLMLGDRHFHPSIQLSSWETLDIRLKKLILKGPWALTYL